MKSSRRIVLAFVAASSLSACATVSISRVTENTPDSAEGLRFYRPALHAVVSRRPPSEKIAVTTVTAPTKAVADGNGGQTEATTTTRVEPTHFQWEVSFIVLPNMDEEYIISHTRGTGSAGYEASLESGWNLTSLTVNQDGQADEMTAAVLAPLASFGEALAGLLNSGPEDQVEPGIYRLEWINGQWKLGPRVF